MDFSAAVWFSSAAQPKGALGRFWVASARQMDEPSWVFGQGGTVHDAVPLKWATGPPQKSLGWFGGRRGPQGNDLLGSCLLYLPRRALSHAWG